MKKYTVFSTFALASLLVSPINSALAEEFLFVFVSTVTENGNLPPTVSAGDEAIIAVWVDNGASSAISQAWDESHIQKVAVQTYNFETETFYYSEEQPRSTFTELSGDTGTIETDALGEVVSISANWNTPLSPGNTDTNGAEGQYWAIDNTNDVWFAGGNSISFADGTDQVELWEPPSQVPFFESYSSTTSDEQKIERLNEDCNRLSAIISEKTHIQPFTVDVAGAYLIASVQNYNGYLHLLDASNACLIGNNNASGCPVFNDGSNPDTCSSISYDLLANKTYFLNTSGNSNESGKFTNSFSGPGKVSFGEVSRKFGDCNGDDDINIQDVVCTINKVLATP